MAKRVTIIPTEPFDPMDILGQLELAGFSMLSRGCPFKIKPPWRLDKNRITGLFTYHQWSPDQKEPEEGPWGSRVDGKP